MESVHTSPAAMVHLIFPVPYFKVRNHHLKQYFGLILNALAEMMQHTENRKPYEISTRFSGVVGQYLHRVYRLMATELFGVEPERAKALDFTLTAAELAAYDPGKWFTSTEMIDTVAPLQLVPTEDDLLVLTDGLPATQLVGLSAYPSGAAINAGSVGNAASSGSASTASASFAPAPAL
jgi:hypothetical protein